MIAEADLLKALPAAVYVTDAEGRITFYNEAAAALWGHRPRIGSAEWCGSWRLFFPEGRPMRHDECPMAVALREGRPCLGHEAIAERPDGSRVPFMAFPSPVKDGEGRVIGGINLLIDTSERRQAEIDAARLAAIVSSSEDAIVSKTLEGVVTSWNGGAERIFGYAPEEMIGGSIKRIIPPELLHQEDEILARLRCGKRVEPFDTVRLAKDGRRVDISLTVSPIRDGAGVVVGASKVARDIGERKRHEDMQRLLFDELNHRVKNTLATIQAIASQSMQKAATPRDFVAGFNGRVQALARAHDLLVQRKMQGAELRELLRDHVALGPAEEARIVISGPEVVLNARLAVQLALVLHELATNARRYGALCAPAGRLSIGWTIEMQRGRELHLAWRETEVRRVSAPGAGGFGMTLIERSLAANGGEAAFRYADDGLHCEIRLPVPEDPDRTAAGEHPALHAAAGSADAGGVDRLRGLRVLLVEDEPLVALDIEAELLELGLEVVGPASTVGMAEQIVAERGFDLALLDANLNGESVEQLAAQVAALGVPFAFATGYGREALPPAFRDAPLLAKPFDRARLRATLDELLDRGAREDRVVPLRPRGS